MRIRLKLPQVYQEYPVNLSCGKTLRVCGRTAIHFQGSQRKVFSQYQVDPFEKWSYSCNGSAMIPADHCTSCRQL